MTERVERSVAFIGSYVPRKCGIATFTHDLAAAVSMDVYGRDLSDGAKVSIVAMNDRDGKYAYGPEVIAEISQYRREDYRTAADILNASKIDVVSLQHEYGLFGGEWGDYLFELLDRLQKPLVSTLHTVVSDPTREQRDVLRRIHERSNAVVVMAERARILLGQAYGLPQDRIRVIHHGVPDVPFTDTESFKGRFGVSGRPTILTFGLLNPFKNIEIVLDALSKVVADHRDVAYVILGETHPATLREFGEEYRLSLQRRAEELGIYKNVFFHNRYVCIADLREYLQAADIYVTPYGNKEQITSGTLAYAFASGRAVISTPYWHAQELLSGGRGRLVNFNDPDDLAAALRELLENPQKRERMRLAAYEFGRAMIWPRVGEQYAHTFDEACASFATMASDLVGKQQPRMRMSLPEVRLDRLFALTDGTGVLQHAAYLTPDRTYGYCTDDNARALIVTSMVWSLFQDDQVAAQLNVYLSFLHFAHDTKTGRFRNSMSYDRRWLEGDGGDDCQGRAIWALGYLVSHAPNEATARLATDLLRSALARVDALQRPLSWALSILGLHYYLRAVEDDQSARDSLARLAYRLNSRFVERGSQDWPWLQDVVKCDNGRLPQALIIAGVDLGRQELIDRGMHILRWLLDVQTAEEGHLSVIGNKGWLRRKGERARFEQQPIEPASLIGACKEAYRACGGREWLFEMRRCFEWYLGRNDIGQSVVDFSSRGCCDGLKQEGVNRNQGAESVLSWLLSLLIMHEMQTGDALDVATATSTKSAPVDGLLRPGRRAAAAEIRVPRLSESDAVQSSSVSRLDS